MRFPLPALVLAGLTAACLAGATASAQPAGPPAKLVVTSSAFEPNAPSPAKYTCDGADVPPPLAWTGVPAGAKSLVLLVDDASRKTPWNQWIVWNLPPTTGGLPEGGALPAAARQGPNDYQKTAWTGPCPSSSGAREYYFQVFALDVELGAGPFARKALVEAMAGHVVAEGTLVGTYERAAKK